MSDTETESPRRSQRARKQAKLFQTVDSVAKAGKRKRGSEHSDDDVSSNASDADESPDEDSDEDGDTFVSPTKKSRYTRESSSQAGGVTVHAPKRQAKAKSSTADKTTAPRHGRKKGTAAKAAAAGADLAKQLPISSDNALFNTLMNPSAALMSTVEDVCDTLKESPGLAIADIINCVLRACGCNESVDADSAIDWDGVVDALDYFTEAVKQEDTPIYPLTSKLPVFKKLRKSLNEFLDRLIKSTADIGLLYDTDLMQALTTWIVAMSSSQIRSFRHTATVLALEIETALGGVAAAVEKEADITTRAREGERKRRAAKGGASGAREKELDAKSAEIRTRKDQLKEWLEAFYDGVFLHRHRDFDPAIRMECIHAMGRWFKKHPSHFLNQDCLRYVEWVLSDASTPVRVASVQALQQAYSNGEYVQSFTTFTERCKSRLVEMAQRDTDLSVRTSVIDVLTTIDEHGQLSEEQRDELCLLVFDEEPRIRYAVAGFVRGVWKEARDQSLVTKKVSEKETLWAGAKTLAGLLIQWGKMLVKAEGESDVMDDDESQSRASSSMLPQPAPVYQDTSDRGRTALVVKALWEEVDVVSEWRDLLELLLLDHSAESDSSQSAPARDRRQKNAKATTSSYIKDAWRLEEDQEGVLLEVLVGALQHIATKSTSNKKGVDETAISDMTTELIKSLPALFIKHQTDSSRVIHVLRIPMLMDIDMYLEMRMMTAYANLWTDISKQFLSHTSPEVQTQAAVILVHLLSVTSLSNSSSEKMQELEDDFATSIRDVIAGRDGLEMQSFSEDDILTLTAICTRLSVLGARRDLASWVDEDEGGKQSSIWSIVTALTERGKLGYKEEEPMVQHALRFMLTHVIWKARRLLTEESETPDASLLELVRGQQRVLVDQVTEFALGTRSNTGEIVKQEAFQALMTLQVFFSKSRMTASQDDDEAESLALQLDDEVQYRCAGFVQAAIERYAEVLEEQTPSSAKGVDSDSGSSTEGEGSKMKRKKASKRKVAKGADEPDSNRPAPHLEPQQEYTFFKLITAFMHGIFTGAIGLRHSSALLAHYGRLDITYDYCVKALIDVLRDEGMYKDNGTQVAEVIFQAVTESFNMFLDGTESSEEHTIILVKALLPCFVQRGAHLAIVRRLESQHIISVHTSLLTWIGKKIGTFEIKKDKNGRNSAAAFFKVLTPLLVVSLDSRNALRIKAHMDQVLAQTKVQISPKSKIWDGQRAYEKKLWSAVSKEKGKKPPAESALKSAAAVTTDNNKETEAPHLVSKVRAKATVPPRPKPRPRHAAAATSAAAYRTQEDDEEEVEVAAEIEDESADERTPSPQPTLSSHSSPRNAPKVLPPPRTPDSLPSSSPLPAASEMSEAEDDSFATISQFTADIDDTSTPLSTKKRARECDPDDENLDADAESSLEPSEQSYELILKWKRVRL